MKTDNKIKQGKNGLRNFKFESVQKGKFVYHHDTHFGHYTEKLTNFFYTKKCLYCDREFEGKRVDATFCSQNCQKAHLRLRNK